MPCKPESTLVKHLMRHLNGIGGVWVKMHGNQFSGRGHPDIIGCYMGRFHGIEVKRPGQKPTPLQSFRIERIRAAGGVAAIVHNLSELQEVLGGDIQGGREARPAHAGTS